MNLKTSEYELLKKISSLLPAQSDFERLPKEDQEIIVKYDALLIDLYRRKQESNHKTAQYIAEKRKDNKNYAR